MPKQLTPGDLALIISATGSLELIGRQAEVLDVIADTQRDHAYMGKQFTGAADGSLCAFILIPGVGVRLWSQSRLMKLRGAMATVVRAEVAHG